MHRGNSALDGAQNVPVEEAIEISRQTALDAHLGGACFPRFAGLADNVVDRKGIGIRRAGAFAKSAKAAANEADVWEIDVAVYAVGNRVADGFAPQRIGDRNERF